MLEGVCSPGSITILAPDASANDVRSPASSCEPVAGCCKSLFFSVLSEIGLLGVEYCTSVARRKSTHSSKTTDSRNMRTQSTFYLVEECVLPGSNEVDHFRLAF